MINRIETSLVRPTTQLQQSAEWNTRECSLHLTYKSGSTTTIRGSVQAMRERVLKAIRRKGLSYAKVTIHDHMTQRIVYCVWDIDTAWIRYSREMPKVKD